VVLSQAVGDPTAVRDRVGDPPLRGRVQAGARFVDCRGIVVQMHAPAASGDHSCVEQYC
jgi:hypothetical protein